MLLIEGGCPTRGSALRPKRCSHLPTRCLELKILSQCASSRSSTLLTPAKDGHLSTGVNINGVNILFPLNHICQNSAKPCYKIIRTKLIQTTDRGSPGLLDQTFCSHSPGICIFNRLLHWCLYSQPCSRFPWSRQTCQISVCLRVAR